MMIMSAAGIGVWFFFAENGGWGVRELWMLERIGGVFRRKENFWWGDPRLHRGATQTSEGLDSISASRRNHRPTVIPRRSPNSNVSKVASYGKVAIWLKIIQLSQ